MGLHHHLIYLNKTGSMISPATTAHIETYNFCGDLWWWSWSHRLRRFASELLLVDSEVLVAIFMRQPSSLRLLNPSPALSLWLQLSLGMFYDPLILTYSSCQSLDIKSLPVQTVDRSKISFERFYISFFSKQVNLYTSPWYSDVPQVWCQFLPAQSR